MTKSPCERYYDRVAHSYDDSYSTNPDGFSERGPGTGKNPYWDFYNAVTWHNLKKYLPQLKGRRILDIGGGTGLWALKLAKSGFEVTLADISQKMLDMALNKAEKANLSSKITFVKADICDLSVFEEKTFDMVLAQGDPLSCCENPYQAVKEAYRILKDKGFFIASVDNKYSGMKVFLEQNKIDELEEFIKSGKTKWFTNDINEQYPITYFTPAQLKKLFTGNGFEVLTIIGKTVLPIRQNSVPMLRYGTLRIRSDAHERSAPYPKASGRRHRSEILKDRSAFDRLLKLELQLHSEEALLGSAGHLEITGRK
ncbi:MAG: methyltransferase domain-containing protein [Planctomycetota bacterium]